MEHKGSKFCGLLQAVFDVSGKFCCHFAADFDYFDRKGYTDFYGLFKACSKVSVCPFDSVVNDAACRVFHDVLHSGGFPDATQTGY